MSQQDERPTKRAKKCKKVTFNVSKTKQDEFNIKLGDIITKYTSGEVSLFIIKSDEKSSIKFKISLVEYNNNTWKYKFGEPINFDLNKLNDLNIGLKLKNFNFSTTNEDEFTLLKKTSELYSDALILKESLDEISADIEDGEEFTDKELESHKEDKINLQKMEILLNNAISLCKLKSDCKYVLYLHAQFNMITATAIRDYLKISKKETLTNSEKNILEKAKKIMNKQIEKNINYNSNYHITEEKMKQMIFKGYYCYIEEDLI